MQTEQLKWRVACSTVAGSAHRKSGKGCQDAGKFCFPYCGCLVAVLADGAGSARHGEAGAKIAVDVAIDSLADGLGLAGPRDNETGWRELTRDIIAAAKDRIERKARFRKASDRDYATTLIMLMATHDCVAAAQIGDGAIVLEPSGGEAFALTQPPDSGYLNETTFLTDSNALDSIQYAFWSGNPGRIAAFTDGLQMLALKMPGAKPHVPFFAPLFDFAARIDNQEDASAELTQFLTSDRVLTRTNDDLTLLLASLAPE